MNGPTGKDFLPAQQNAVRGIAPQPGAFQKIEPPFFPLPWLPILPVLPPAFSSAPRLQPQTTVFEHRGTAALPSWTSYGVPWRYDASHYSPGAKFYFEAFFWLVSTPGQGWARLADYDSGHEVPHSFVGNGTVNQRLTRSPEISLVDGRTYVAQFAADIVSNGRTQGAHVVVV